MHDNVDTKLLTEGIRQKLLSWYDQNHRDLPWRRETDPYRIWLSEVMLQQTRVNTVIPYYLRFLDKFPTLSSLANADEQEVLKLWEGLGYYARGRNFLDAVKEVQGTYGGEVPSDPVDFKKLRGVGDYSSAAVLSIAYQKPLAAVDGNVVRVTCRLFLIEDDTTKSSTLKLIKGTAKNLLDPHRPGDFNQAMMEMGAVICLPRNPQCLKCILTKECLAYQRGKAEELPLRKKTGHIPTIEYAAAIITKERRCLLHKRDRNGMLGGLWELPFIKKKNKKKNELEESFSFLLKNVVTLKKRIIQLNHTFSHQHWKVSVYPAESPDPSPDNKKNWRWANTEDISSLPFPKFYHPLLPDILKKLQQ
ncbi:A/G-specific adenine glycosylase [Candidatus Contubernalis alkaliaceticus]|uniref:A/G-specific adenine glycosylase n=1 Tax=Candidatus Contubernalis alkaliaceticus TaxID=338645 RepID=UPI001F4C389D|nr:A/G-specific adenine glycosylase [Candidatus Contubernalis alkalaceticus]UNC93290.1 A/G-specific adenine glycosylase [Candidatus Contubernalis alkalaceticus]